MLSATFQVSRSKNILRVVFIMQHFLVNTHFKNVADFWLIHSTFYVPKVLKCREMKMDTISQPPLLHRYRFIMVFKN